MIYLSQLIPDNELYTLLSQYPVGLELIDFSVGMNLDQNATYIKKWKTQLDIWKNPPLTLHGPFLDLNPASYDFSIEHASWERFHQAYQAAEYLSANKLIIHTCRVPLVCYQEGWAARAADFWNRFLNSHSKISIAIENVFDESPELIQEFASHMDAENFSLCLDVGHANCFSDASVSTWIQLLTPWISHLHLHDNHGCKDEHLALGAGTISWTQLLDKFSSLPHLEGATLENTYMSDFKTSLEFLRKKGHSL